MTCGTSVPNFTQPQPHPPSGGAQRDTTGRVMTTYFRFPPVAVLWASDQAHMTLFYIAGFFFKHINFFLV